VDKGRPGYSWLRVGLLALLYSLFGLSLFWLTDFPATAYRGGFSKWAAVVSLFLAVPLTVAVIAFVLDATFLCRRFVRFLIREYDDRTNNDPWPKAATRRLKEDRGKDYPRDLIRAILLVRLIAHHTKRVARLVYAPFVLVLLLAAARYPGLDYFVFPWTLVLLIGFSLAVLVYNAVALRGQAERAREHLLRRLTDVRPRAALPSSGDRQEQYRLAMSEIQQEQGGAFRPWIQDPIVKAFLIPLGGVGGLALIEQIFPLLP
jgi:hypothetical protein